MRNKTKDKTIEDEKKEMYEVTEISKETLEKLIRKCAKDDQNNEDIYRRNELRKEMHVTNELAKEIELKLSLGAIEELEIEVGAMRKLDDNLVNDMHEGEIIFLN